VSHEEIDFAAEGLLDGLDGESRRERLALLELLHSQGSGLAELRRLTERGTLIFGGANRVILGGDERYTAAQVAELAGIELETFLAGRRAIGLPISDPGEAAYTDADLESARLIGAGRAAGVPDEEMLDLVRVLGRGLAQAAETLRALPLKMVMSPGISERELAERYAESVARLYPLLDPLLRNLLALQLRQATQEEVVNAMERSGGTLPGSRRVAICFADLVGFTRIGEEVPAVELGMLAARLERIAEQVAVPPVRLVKTIGDAAMLACPEPAALVDASLSLIDAADGEGADFPQLRVGAALGVALPRAGDWFGRPVNIASRITSVARPGSMLVDSAMREACGEAFRFSFAGERRLRGIREPALLFRTRRAG